MVKLIVSLLLVCLVFFSSSCAFIQDEDADLIQIGVLTQSLAEVYYTLSERIQEIAQKPEVAEEDKLKLRSIDLRAKDLLESFKGLRDGHPISDVELYKLFSRAKALYVEGRPIISKYLILVSPSAQEYLIKFDIDAIKLDRLVEKTEHTYNANTTAINSIYGFITSTLKLVLASLVVL